MVAAAFFVLLGWGVRRGIGAPRSETWPGELATCYLAGVAANGIALYVLALVHVPIVRLTEIVILIGAVAASFRRAPANGRISHSWPATLLLVLPCACLLVAATVLPIRDYDGRVTWLPKAVAIATTGTIDGPFFQGREGLNLHNHYPLLMPLDDAGLMLLCGSTANETVRWFYALIPIAALFAARDRLYALCGRFGSWSIAAMAWLPILTSIEGGALAAYNDCAIAAFTGLAVLYAMSGEDRMLALMLAALVLTKNEGTIIAFAIAALAFRWRPILGPAAAAIVLALWRLRVPAAYDEQYTVLAKELPAQLHKAPTAIAALAKHAFDVNEWGVFWFAAIVALALSVRNKRSFIPAATLLLLLLADVLALTVTSWDINELAGVAANRLLLQAAIPACILIALAAERIAELPSAP